MIKKAVFNVLEAKAKRKENKLLTYGIYEGSQVEIIKDDVRNGLLIIGVGNKRIVLRKNELSGLQFQTVNG